MKQRFIEITSKQYNTNEGYIAIIKKYYSYLNITIQLNDDNKTILHKITLSNLKSGRIKNPYHKSVCNIGYLGKGKYKCKINKKLTKEYIFWSSMINRCYNISYLERNPLYKNIEICEEWLNFQNFAKWFKKNYINNCELDKDILIKGNKIYSPKTCCFVPQEINKLFTKSNKVRGILPIGVQYRKDIKKFKSTLSKENKQVHLGYYDTPEEAFNIYKIEKEKYIKEMADKYKLIISDLIFNKLYEYNVEITD